MMTIEDIKKTIDDTIAYIKKKYPNEQQENTMDHWLALIGEEFGELCMAVNDGETNNVIEEGTQTCAAIICMLEAFIYKSGLSNKTNVVAPKVYRVKLNVNAGDIDK